MNTSCGDIENKEAVKIRLGIEFYAQVNAVKPRANGIWWSLTTTEAKNCLTIGIGRDKNPPFPLAQSDI
jgi:hypothetical protein